MEGRRQKEEAAPNEMSNLRKRGSRLLLKAHYMPEARPTTQPIVVSYATSLIKRLCAHGSFGLARRAFDEMPERDVVAWTAMISGYASSDRHADAWDTFRCMLSAGVGPNEYTVSSVLTACRGLRWLGAGAAVHAVSVRRGVSCGAYVENSLLDMYAGCGGDADAEALFERMPDKTTASWTTMIAACARRGDGRRGVLLFKRMFQEGAELNAFACSIAIHACGLIGEVALGGLLHALAFKAGHYTNLPVANSLLDMYAKCTSLPDAKKLFYEMQQRDMITWNTMIASLEGSNSHEALRLFLDMTSQGLGPNSFTLSSIAAACANLAMLNCGQQIHGTVVRRGLGGSVQIANAIIHMYAKSGHMAESRKVFEEMDHKDLLTWTSLMIGYGMNGHGAEAIQLFGEMILAGIRPDQVVFMGVISACSHAGLVDQGLSYFHSMSAQYNIPATREVYGCAIDLLGRAGRLAEAYELIESMPFQPDESIWGALLGACKVHKNVSLGRVAAQRILEINPNAANAYVMLSNIYAAGKEWEEFAGIRSLLRGSRSRKEAGMSWVEVRNEVCGFASGDRGSPHVVLVYRVLSVLIRHMNDEEHGSGSDLMLLDDVEVNSNAII